MRDMKYRMFFQRTRVFPSAPCVIVVVPTAVVSTDANDMLSSPAEADVSSCEKHLQKAPACAFAKCDARGRGMNTNARAVRSGNGGGGDPTAM